ncbi:hypothetical protein BDN70DRAFT_413887 [Pholiota conissans]|uniref:NACHT domain-containing protein n=1 Tax=Pholiota conissans TaxID=109636 RepID=A0A9P5YSB5_9AGAR|nr:hypothetical protein BDN70DRAFT_413887 [Pholiota conissans]
MQTLIVKPVNDFTSCLTKASTLKRVKPKLIIVDGLDEAREETTQKELLDTLAASFYQLHIPLIFIVASRPEYVIRQAFNREPLRSLTKGMALDEHYKSDEDIRVFLRLKFKEIKELHPLGKNLPNPWPSENDMKYLVLKSSGQFIFASTVIKYIDSPRHNPARRLKIVLGLSSPGKDTPFAQLDTLYDLILSSVNDISKVLDILALIFLQTGYDIYLTIDFIETLLNLESGDVLTALTDMHALIRIPSMENDDDQLHVYHASLQDFLMDKSRAGRFFLDAQAYHVALAHYLLCYVNNAFTSECKGDRLQAVLNGFIDHFLQISESDEIVCCLRNFSLTKFLRIDTFYATKWDAFFHHLQTQCSAVKPIRTYLSAFKTSLIHGFLPDTNNTRN